uniref:Uncharacterized protein n=1 Tax=Branchiostoma floridae TaxID=7739 RepID=C3YC62_BRAFL|eukprot:XP_002606084.1 hypothetical protein BRAFLDRAFT_87994 [Branchiostoma floridae]
MASQQEFLCSRCHEILRTHEIRNECHSGLRQHWGQYDYSRDTWDIQREWSCCLEEQEDAPGCRRQAHDVMPTVQGLKIQTSVHDLPSSLVKSPVLDTSYYSKSEDQSVPTFKAEEQVDQEQDHHSYPELDPTREEENLERRNLQTETNGERVGSVARRPFVYVPMYLPKETVKDTSTSTSEDYSIDSPLEVEPLLEESNNCEPQTDANGTMTYISRVRTQDANSSQKQEDYDEETGPPSQKFTHVSAVKGDGLENATFRKRGELESEPRVATFSSSERGVQNGIHSYGQKDHISDQQGRSRVVDLYQEWLDKLELESPAASSTPLPKSPASRKLKNIQKDRRFQSDDNLSAQNVARSHLSLPRQQPHRLTECRSLFSSAMDLTLCLRSPDQDRKNVKCSANIRSAQQSEREKHMIPLETDRTSYVKKPLGNGENDGVEKRQKMSDLTGMKRWIRPTYTSLFPSSSDSRFNSAAALPSDKSKNCKKKLTHAGAPPCGHSKSVGEQRGVNPPPYVSRFCTKTTTEDSPVVVVFHVTLQSFSTVLAHHSDSPAAKYTNSSGKRVN